MARSSLSRQVLLKVSDLEALGTPNEGELGYDDTENIAKFYDGSTWRSMDASGGTAPNQPNCRVYRDSTTAVANGGFTFTPIDFNQERWDTDACHANSGAALSGTVSTTAGSAAVTGSGTSFTTQLAVGDLVLVNGITPFVVESIASNTSLTAHAAVSDTQSAKGYAKSGHGLVCKSAGKYLVGLEVGFASNATGYRGAAIAKNSLTSGWEAADYHPATNGDQTICSVIAQVDLGARDLVIPGVYQTSGGSLNLTASSATDRRQQDFWMVRVSV